MRPRPIQPSRSRGLDVEEQRELGAGQDCHVQVGLFSGVGDARLDDNQLHFRAMRAGLFPAAEPIGWI